LYCQLKISKNGLRSFESLTDVRSFNLIFLNSGSCRRRNQGRAPPRKAKKRPRRKEERQKEEKENEKVKEEKEKTRKGVSTDKCNSNIAAY
jgi:hypothetical protein